MKRYEKNIGLKTFVLTFVRRFDILIYIFFPIFIGSFLVTNLVMKRNYISYVTLSKSTTITTSEFNTIKSTTAGNKVVQSAVSNLKEKKIKHSNGSSISASDIKSGISFSTYSSSKSVTFSYKSTDKRIVTYVLSEISSLAVEELTKQSALGDLIIDSPASKSSLDGKNMKYFLIASAAGAALAVVVGFIFEAATDQVYDYKDVNYYGSEGLELKTKVLKEKKEND